MGFLVEAIFAAIGFLLTIDPPPARPYAPEARPRSRPSFILRIRKMW